MIYIFDDRAERRGNNENKLRKYSNCKFVDLNPGQTVENWVLEAIGTADCVIFHKSYAFKDETDTFESTREHLKVLDVPIVIFSGGLENSSKGDAEINMNADMMYNNLPLFLENFENNGELNIDILLWGKRYELNAILRFQNEIAKRYLINCNLSATIENLERLKRFLKQESSRLKRTFADEFLLAINGCENPTWQDMSDILDEKIRKFV